VLGAKLTCYLLSKLKFRNYEPQPIRYKTVNEWLEQFGGRTQWQLVSLLSRLTFVSNREIRTILSSLNRTLLRDLKKQGVPPENVVYVQVDEAGSSSQWVLNMLRNDDRLLSLGCKLLDSKDGTGLLETTFKLGYGAIVYVDDFVGTGNQFCKSRDFVSQQILGQFVEFLIVPYVCEEALDPLNKRSIEYRSLAVHRKSDRLLHPDSNICSRQLKADLLKVCRRVDRRFSLGYHNLGSMIVYARNCPNTTPAVLRGNKGQDPFVGLLPRVTDLPPHPEE
jgi:hypothetical protein